MTKSALLSATTNLTRDQWLAEFIEKARPEFERAGQPLPANVRAAICPPHRNKMRYIGLCWSDKAVSDGGREIWVTAAETDPVQCAAILVHELCHAALPHTEKHGKAFGRLARRMGLEGPLRATHGGEAFRKLWAGVLIYLGPLPAAKFMAVPAAADFRIQKTPKAKNLSCPQCGFTAKVQLLHMDWGRLVCPIHTEQMLLAKGEKGWVYR